LRGLVGRSADSFAYLRGSEKVVLLGADEVEDFEATLLAMRTVGLKNHEVSDILHCIAAVLHLGNIDFAEVTSEAAEATSTDAYDSDAQPPIETVADLLGVTTASLRASLCSRTMQAPGDRIIVMQNTSQKAKDCRDALARFVYQAVFLHLVKRTNESIGFHVEAISCGVLDIFGFEFFEENSFEQLAINLTNEVLQQYFNTFIFENETTLYHEEGITWEPLDFPDNSAIVRLLSQKVTGIFPMLDEECFSVGGSSAAWRSKIVKEHEQHLNFEAIKHKQGTFIVKHFAGPVEYTAEGFLEKNRDQLSQDLLQCLHGSRRAFVRERFSGQRAFGAGRTSNAGHPSRVVKAQRYSVSSEFRLQLNDLMTRIRATKPHFVRCIKPNSKCKAFVDATAPNPEPLMDRHSVTEQLRYQGVLEAIRVARAGFPVRFLHWEFLADFRILVSEVLRSRIEAELHVDNNRRELVIELLAAPEIRALFAAQAGNSGAERIEWSIGLTRVFLKQEPFSALKSAQAKKRHEVATRIQAAQRCRVAYGAFVKFRWAVLRLQGRARGRATRHEIWREKRELSAIHLEAAARTLLACRAVARVRGATSVAQKSARMMQCRRQYFADRAKVMQLQRWWRSLTKRRRFRNLQKNVLDIQRVWRGASGRREALEFLARIHRVKTVVKRLVRVHRKNLEHRAWRKKMMALYKNRDARPTAPPKELLIQELLELHKNFQAQEAEVQQLRARRRSLERHVEDLRGRAYLRLRAFMTGCPA